ncbi:Glycosyltransferase involved in cell wall bisynthesis [Haladaptatus litoreus]|uniref:Glycosyltransferase involved in cell wall bisynthesis n=1 Tax=Haladaptatus litoreus TaxID=553468 RepID=A0A1N6YXR1_9EURY|nr:glycosyltransferase [Haladaptatus litoreus]SIR19404.1 Glycosyltransferase involved in cell wall bisynthesis [Haladaptatus litoreus]
MTGDGFSGYEFPRCGYDRPVALDESIKRRITKQFSGDISTTVTRGAMQSRTGTESSLRVLNLVTNADARFFNEQVRVLREFGVRGETLSPTGIHRARDDSVTRRSPTDYLRFFPTVMRNSLGEYDLIHANYGLTAPMALAQPRLPVVLSLWGSDLLGEYGWLSKRCARHCDAVIVMSEGMAEELDSDCHVIPHGINLSRFAPMPKAEAREEVGWSEQKKQVLFPYPPTREVKDFPRAERVVAETAERVDGQVELQSVFGVPHDEMANYYNAADVLLLPSKSEGSPNSVKEAMACNLPVVTTDVGDVRDRLSDVSPSHVCSSDGELVAGLVDVLADPRRSNGREHVRDISLERMGERIHSVYETVVQ